MIRIVEMDLCEAPLDLKLLQAQEMARRFATNRENRGRNIIVDIIYDSLRKTYRIAEYLNGRHDKLNRYEDVVCQLFKQRNSEHCTVR